MPWISNHKHKIEEKSTKSSRSSSKVVGLGLADLWEFPTLPGLTRLSSKMPWMALSCANGSSGTLATPRYSVSSGSVSSKQYSTRGCKKCTGQRSRTDQIKVSYEVQLQKVMKIAWVLDNPWHLRPLWNVVILERSLGPSEVKGQHSYGSTLAQVMWPQAITWTNVDLSTTRFSGIHSKVTFTRIRKISVPVFEIYALIITATFPRGQWVNSLWPSDAIWQQGTESPLAQVMACCLTAPSRYLNQCWLIMSKVLWHSSEGIIMSRSEDTNQ